MTSAKSCGQGVVGDNTMRTKALRASRVLDKRGQAGDKWETSLKSCFVGDNWEKPSECTGRQVGDKWRQVRDKPEIMRDKWETSVKSRRQKHSHHPECTGRQVKTSQDKWETSLKLRGQRIQSAVGDN